MEYLIAVDWAVSGFMKIEADSLEAAKNIAENTDLPEECEYIDGSFNINHEVTEELNTWQQPKEEAQAKRSRRRDLLLRWHEKHTDDA